MTHPETFRLIVFFSVLGAMFVAESLWAARPWETARGQRWFFHGFVSVFNTVVTRLLFVGPIFFWIQFLQEKQWGLSHALGLSGVGEILATLILFDAFDYWWHRFNHRVPFLWRFHKAHHLDTHVDVTTSLRFHPGELFFSYLAKAVWIFVWGPSLLGFVIFESAITAYAQFHHADIDFPNPVEQLLRWIHMTPRLHTSHHTVTERTRDGNFSTIFLIWDRIFGTFREPDRGEMNRLGLAEGRETYLSLRALLNAPFMKSEIRGSGVVT